MAWFKRCNKINKGFTFVELLIVLAVMSILVSISVPIFIFFRKESGLNNDAEEIIGLLNLAQNKTVASEDLGQYGVYFDATSSPNRIVFFKGNSFSNRDVSFDKVYNLSQDIGIFGINLGGKNEVVFEKLTGFSLQQGFISLGVLPDNAKTISVYIESSGNASFTVPTAPSGGLIQDSRHIHVDYSRLIDLSSEKITLSFEGGVVQEIPIIDFLQNGVFYWEGEIDVGGDKQMIKIHTHRLNNSDTQWCIHRDRRYNDKALAISISGDASGSFVIYSADGSVSYESIYVSSYEKQ